MSSVVKAGVEAQNAAVLHPINVFLFVLFVIHVLFVSFVCWISVKLGRNRVEVVCFILAKYGPVSSRGSSTSLLVSGCFGPNIILKQ